MLNKLEQFIEIPMDHNVYDFIEKYAEKQTIGGFSNLKSQDLSKASRLDFQYTGLYGEAAFFLFRDKSIDRLKSILDEKNTNFKLTKKGDNGFDDSITYNNKTRFVDIKTSHIDDFSAINKLNLIIPQREYHNNMIYVCAFSIGKEKKDRKNVEKVILQGWVFNEDVHKRWKYDASKFCVPVNELKPMSELKEFL